MCVIINILVRTVFAASYRFWFIVSYFHFCQDIFISLLISSLIHWLYRSISFNFHVFLKFPAFLLLLIASVIPLWSEKVLDIISNFLNFLRFVLWSNICILENVPCVLEKNIYSTAVGQNILYMSVGYIWSLVFKSTIFLLTLCLDY